MGAGLSPRAQEMSPHKDRVESLTLTDTAERQVVNTVQFSGESPQHPFLSEEPVDVNDLLKRKRQPLNLYPSLPLRPKEEMTKKND